MHLKNEVFPLYGILTCSEEIQYNDNALLLEDHAAGRDKETIFFT